MSDEADEADAFNAQMDANRPAVVAVKGGAVAAGNSKVPALWSDDGDWVEATLHRRPWVVPGYLMRGAVTVVAGPGSAGKSSLMVAWAVAAALGVPLGRFAPPQPLTVLTYNVEDDADEQRRRLSAALTQFSAYPSTIRGKVVRCGPSGVGTLLERDLMGQIVKTANWTALEKLLEDRRPDIVILDPLVELHTAEENDNTALRLVIAHIRELAQRFRCAIILVHHVRKGATAGDVDGIRGAGSLVGAARAVFTVAPMSEEEAEQLGISGVARRGYVRVDSVKGNYAPAQEADWHELQEYELANGETVAAMVPWRAPVAAGPSPETLALVEAELARGTAGGPYSPRLAVDQPRSVAALLARHGMCTAQAQKAFLKALLTSGWEVVRFRDRDGDPRSGLRSPAGLPDARWLDGREGD